MERARRFPRADGGGDKAKNTPGALLLATIARGIFSRCGVSGGDGDASPGPAVPTRPRCCRGAPRGPPGARGCFPGAVETVTLETKTQTPRPLPPPAESRRCLLPSPLPPPAAPLPLSPPAPPPQKTRGWHPKAQPRSCFWGIAPPCGMLASLPSVPGLWGFMGQTLLGGIDVPNPMARGRPSLPHRRAPDPERCQAPSTTQSPRPKPSGGCGSSTASRPQPAARDKNNRAGEGRSNGSRSAPCYQVPSAWGRPGWGALPPPKWDRVHSTVLGSLSLTWDERGPVPLYGVKGFRWPPRGFGDNLGALVQGQPPSFSHSRPQAPSTHQKPSGWERAVCAQGTGQRPRCLLPKIRQRAAATPGAGGRGRAYVRMFWCRGQLASRARIN